MKDYSSIDDFFQFLEITKAEVVFATSKAALEIKTLLNHYSLDF